MPSPPSPPRDPHQILGIARTATPAEIAAAYRALVRALHPDAQHQPTDPAHLAAYSLLRDPHSRATYDRQHPGTASPPDPGTTAVPVRVHPARPHRQPDIRVGPVRHHPE